MSWEQRGQRAYYYQVRRDQNGSLVKTYCGSGIIAKRTAEEDNHKRTIRNTDRMEQKMSEALDAQVANLDTLITLLSQTLLVDGRWYRHNRGEWRRRRKDGRNASTLPTTP